MAKVTELLTTTLCYKSMISIIIPIYNIEKELPRCLDSIISQENKQWEAILINDGSSDSSADICAEYCKKESRFRYIEQDNQGVATARRVGVEASTGDYIIFVDPDDSLPSGAIDALEGAMDDGVDIVISSYYIHTPKRSYQKRFNYSQLTKEEWLRELLLDRAPHEPWAKIFRRSLFTPTSFPSLKRGQDWLSNIEVATRCRAIRYIDTPCYNYFHRDNSTMRKHKYGVESSEEFCSRVGEIMQRSGTFKQCEEEFLRLELGQISIAMTKGAAVSVKNHWVGEVYKLTRQLKCTPKERISRYAIKYIAIQRFVQLVARIYRLVRG